MVASTLKFLDSEPDQVGHVLSIVRQWRKYVALSHQFQNQDLFAGRFALVRYEDEVTNPERFARELCEMLELPYQPAMIEFSRYEDQARDRQWTGNSAFESTFTRIDPSPAQRWRSTLEPDALAAIEYCCAADMALCGYDAAHSVGDSLTGMIASARFWCGTGNVPALGGPTAATRMPTMRWRPLAAGCCVTPIQPRAAEIGARFSRRPISI